MPVCLLMWPGDKLATCPGRNRRLHPKRLQKTKPNQPNTCAHVHSSSVIHYLQTNRPLDNDHDARQPGAGKRGRTEQKRCIGFLPTIHQTRLPGLMNGRSRTVAGLSLSESRFTSVRQINLTPGRACRAAADGEKKAQTDGWGHLGRDGADCEGVCVGAFDACQTVASQGRGERQRSFFFSRMKKRRYSQTAHHMGERLHFVKSTGFDKTQEARETICWSGFTENSGGLETLR